MKVTFAAACVPDHKGDRDRNLSATLGMITRLARDGAHIVTTPEACLQGYAVADEHIPLDRLKADAEPIDGPAARAFRKAAKDNGIYLVACYDRRDGDQYYNSAELISPTGSTIGIYDKVHAASDNDTRLYEPGSALPVFDTEFGKVGILICGDRTYAENWRVLMLKGAKVVLIPANGEYDDFNTNRLLTMAHDQAVGCVFAHPKRGLVIDEQGQLVDRDDEPLRPHAVGTLNLENIETRQASLRRYRRPELYDLLSQS